MVNYSSREALRTVLRKAETSKHIHLYGKFLCCESDLKLLLDSLLKCCIRCITFHCFHVSETLIRGLNQLPFLSIVCFKRCTYSSHLLSLNSNLILSVSVSSAYFYDNIVNFATCDELTVIGAYRPGDAVGVIEQFIESSRVTCFLWKENPMMQCVTREALAMKDMQRIVKMVVSIL